MEEAEEEEDAAAVAIPTILFMAGGVAVVDSVKEEDVVAAAKSRPPLRLPAPRPLSSLPSQSPPLLFIFTKKRRQDRKKTIRFARAGFEYGYGVRQAGRLAGRQFGVCCLRALSPRRTAKRRIMMLHPLCDTAMLAVLVVLAALCRPAKLSR